MTNDYLGVKQVTKYLGVTPEGLLNLQLPDPATAVGRVNAMSVISYVKP